ncbi:hypothetical protein AZH53_10705 [Methanomicrobiaceae archaeon CYW5]|uniref:PKD domain-containing protein n=1 Tax=Methanovulcanius yangii TaxID=1789227 RepID=UPI0029CA8244|nr:PKD domain-containing protein [Methanovulcanius yangii]MBT8508873.1 hypothetical protein [Methanovulcanius yangii]
MSENIREENVVQKGGCIVLVLCLCVGIAAAGDWELRFTSNIGTNNDSQEYFVVGTDPYGWTTYNASIDVAAVPADPGMWLEKKDGVPVICDYQRTINNIYPQQAVYRLNGTNIPAPVNLSFHGFAALPPIVGNITVRYWNDSSTLVVQDIDDVNCTVTMAAAAFNTSVAPFPPNITAYYTSPPKPVPDFNANVTVGEMPLTVQFTNTSSGYGLKNPTWEFGDGPGYLFNVEAPVHTYLLPGRYDVSLTIANIESVSNTTTKTNFITVLAPAPVAAFSAALTPPAGNVPVLVNVTDASAANGGFAIASWYWEFGDGTNFTGQAPPDHLYATEGTYLVKLTVTDSQVPAQTNTTTTALVLSPPLPIADFTASPTSGRMPVTIQFTDLSTGSNISAWAWDFTSDRTVDATEQNPSWAPVGPFPAHYSVTLTVTDENGQNQTTKSDYLYINEAEDGDSGPDYPPVTRAIPTPTVNGSGVASAADETVAILIDGTSGEPADNADAPLASPGPVDASLPASSAGEDPVPPGSSATPVPTTTPLCTFGAATGIGGAAFILLRRRES